jgi:hypothetical protein
MDNKKVFDILPPGQREVIVPKKAEMPAIKKAQKKEATKERPLQQKSGFRLPRILVLIIVLLAIFVLSSEFIFNKAEIKIWPKTDDKNLTEDILVSTAEKAINFESKTIPGEIIEEEQVAHQDFPATGETTEGQKATGKIRVYNTYSTSPQILIKNTRFISSEGKLFKTTEKVVVPGGTYNKGKLQPSYIDVNVAADQPGDEYNIGPSTFSIPGFVGTARYTAFYGKSSEAMSGGSFGKVAQIQKDDLDKAKKELVAKATEEGKNYLKSNLSEEAVLLDGAIFQEILSASSSLPVGYKAATFNYQVKVKLRVMVFSKTDLKNLSEKLIAADLPEGKKIKDGSLNTDYDFYSLDLNSGKMTLKSSLSAKIYSGIDENKFSQNLAGKTLEEARQSISSQPEIDKVQIRSWPFWTSNLPKDQKKLGIKLILD